MGCPQMAGLIRIYLLGGSKSWYSSSTTSYTTFRWAIFPEAIALVAEEKIIIFCLHLHATHVAQPLDVSFFGPLKQHWVKVCPDYMADITGRVVTKFQFSSLFSKARFQIINLATVISGFCKVGVCPFDSTAINLT